MITATENVLQSDVAVAEARAALLIDQYGGAASESATVGAHLGSVLEDEFAAAHYFEAHLPGYRGWQWCVVIAAVPDPDSEPVITVSEAVLLPGDGALVAPAWVPWVDRIRPGDLGPNDRLPTTEDDVRYVPGYELSGDPEFDRVAGEIGLGRERVLSRDARIGVAARWEASEFGPTAPAAVAADYTCATCAFYLPLAGSLGSLFGVCGNEFSADAHVVQRGFGCGAHSSVRPLPSEPIGVPLDDGAIEIFH